MADQGFELDVFQDLLQEAADVERLARGEKTFQTAYEAFRSADRKAFQSAIGRLGLTLHCDRICHWIRIKECVLVCFRLCGPPPKEPPKIDPRLLAQAIVRITSDEKLLRSFAQAIEKQDRAAFQRLIKAQRLGPYCHVICHWLCLVRFRLICRWVCTLELEKRPDFVEELTLAGQALRQLLQKKRVFDAAVAASNQGDAEKLRGVLQGAQLELVCRFICEWFCSWRCVLVCFPLCRLYPIEKLDPIREPFEFARALRELVRQPEQLQKLSLAVGAGDAKAFAAIVEELKLQRFCIQLCHWICFVRCRRFCIIVCPPIFNHPWFTHVGDFAIYGDFDTGTGLTNKAQAGHGGPDYGFFGCNKLRGFCPKTSPAFPGAPMAYRFLYQEGAATPVPITGGLVCEVLVGSRYVMWDVFGTGLAPTLQSVRIRGQNPSPDPPPPPGPPMTPWGFPPDHYVVPDPNGWVRVDPMALDDGYNGWLMGFASWVAFPGGDPAPGVAAGTNVPVAARKNGKDGKLIFEASRVSQIGAPTPDYTNQLDRIHFNNWGEVSLLDILQFHSGGGNACSPLSTDLDIEYTTDHELMATWAVGISTAATISPAPVFPNGTGPRGGFGTDHHNISTWPTCSYTVTLTTRRSLTDGLNDDPDKTNSKTFCIGARRIPPR